MQQSYVDRGRLAFLQDQLEVAVAAFLMEDWPAVEQALTSLRDMADELLPVAKRIER